MFIELREFNCLQVAQVLEFGKISEVGNPTIKNDVLLKLQYLYDPLAQLV